VVEAKSFVVILFLSREGKPKDNENDVKDPVVSIFAFDLFENICSILNIIRFLGYLKFPNFYLECSLVLEG